MVLPFEFGLDARELDVADQADVPVWEQCSAAPKQGNVRS